MDCCKQCAKELLNKPKKKAPKPHNYYDLYKYTPFIVDDKHNFIRKR